MHSYSLMESTRREGDPTQKTLALAVEQGRNEVILMYVDLVKSAILLEAEPIMRWVSDSAPVIKAMIETN